MQKLPGGNKFFRELAAIFLEECPKLVAELREGLEAGEAKDVHRAAHSLKNSANVFIAPELAGITQHIEQLAADEQLATVTDHVPRLQMAADEVCAAVKEWLSKKGINHDKGLDC
jgi:HPt (histidine-containing phosphotransfer) domain-containing protein